MVNEALPSKYRDYHRTMTKGEVDKVLADIAHNDPTKYREISHKLVQLGRETAFTEGTTLKLSDTLVPFDKADILKHVHDQETKILKDLKLTDDEKEKALNIIYGEVHSLILKQTYDTALKNNNPFAIQVKSKARGNPVQLAALMTTPGVYQDANDRTIPVFIDHSYAEGLDPHEFWAATYGARKGVISSKYSTRQAGALGKQFGTAVNTMVVTKDDCGTPYGVPMLAADRDNLGAVLARPAGNIPAGTVITKEVMAKIEKQGDDEIVVRSPMTCSLPEGLCKQCVGMREGGKFPPIGYHVGINAASALAERIAQTSLSAKHSGGQNDPAGKQVYSGFDVVNQLVQIPKTFPNRAAVSEIDGEVTKISPAPQGGMYVTVADKDHYIAPDLPVTVKVGDKLDRGDVLSEGILNPADTVYYKGLGEGRRYFTNRLTQAFRDSNYEVNRRNVEVLSRAMIDHVAVDEQTGLGQYLPGDIISYNALANSYKPRLDATMAEGKKAVGRYLEEPALHYTIGTQLTKKMVDTLNKHGVKSVLTHQEPVGFTPNMVGLTKVPSYTDDWMARLGSSYLESRLLQDVHRGAKSKLHSLNPLPALAKGTELGQHEEGEFTF